MGHTRVGYVVNQLGQEILDTSDPATTPRFSRTGQQRPVVAKSANFTVTADDVGTLFQITGADVTAYLPATAYGLWYEFIVTSLSTSYGFGISPVAADQVIGGGLTPQDDKDVINTAATDAVGDRLLVVADQGGVGWMIAEKVGTWARQA